MRLTRKKAIEISIELWSWLAENGNEDKHDWPDWEKYGEMRSACPLCELFRGSLGCGKCPYYSSLGDCTAYNSPFVKWRDTHSKESAEKYASQFLEQLRRLK